VTSSAWLAAVAAFLSVCKKEFINSFVGTANSRTYTEQCWCWQMEQEPRVADEVIVKLFTRHHDGYKHFENEVTEFISANWEKPKFFTKKFIASIPSSVLSEEIREEVSSREDGMQEDVAS
jgi:hypothetical protein